MITFKFDVVFDPHNSIPSMLRLDYGFVNCKFVSSNTYFFIFGRISRGRSPKRLSSILKGTKE